MGRLALPLIALIVASTITLAGGCASRQKPSGQTPGAAAVAGPLAAITPLAGAPAGDPPADSPGVDPAPPAGVDPAPPAAATSGIVSGSSSSDEDLAGAVILGSNASPTPTPIPGSLPSRVFHAVPGDAKSVALAPFNFLWASLKSHYGGYSAPEEGIASDGEEENTAPNPSATPVPLTQKALNAGAKTYDFTESTIFYPFRLIDDVIGLIFSPF
jgi:hypothetical protein